MTDLDAEDEVESAATGAPSGLLGFVKHHAIDTRPLAIAPFRRQVLGQSASFIGVQLTAVAVPVQVYDLSRSSLQVGYVGLVGLLPIIVFGLYGGAVADVIDRRTLMMFSSIGSWVLTLALLAQTLLHANSVGLILVLVAIQSGFFSVSASTRGAIIPRLMPRELVASANTVMFTAGNVGQVLGPVIAGVLVTREHGFAYAYGIDAALFTLALYAILRLPKMLPVDGAAAKAGVKEVVAGLALIAKMPVLWMAFVADIIAMVFAMPRALFPQAADEHFHGAVGPLYAAIAVGALIFGVGGGWIGRVKRQGLGLTGAVVVWGVAVAVAGLAHQLWLAVLMLAVAGGADLVSAVYRQTIVQTYAPPEMVGRMQGVFMVTAVGGPRLGDLRAGGTAAAAGLTVSWVGGGIICAVLVLIVAFAVRPFWNYRSA